MNSQARGAHSGGNQGTVAAHNERVVLAAVRAQGTLAAADVARATGLQAQTVSLVCKRLLDAGLLQRGQPVRGRVGQPAVPLQLHPEGAYAVGALLGRRGLEVLLVDFTGQVRQRWADRYRHADPRTLLPLLAARLAEVQRTLGPVHARRVVGLGVAAPLNPGGWAALLGLPAAVAARWQRTDLPTEVAAISPWPVTMLKDTAAAAAAELVAGQGRAHGDFLHVYLDTFVGGGLVLGGRLHTGLQGNAGALGSLALGPATRARGALPPQLLAQASLQTLQAALEAAGLDGEAAYDQRALQAPWRRHTQHWLGEASLALALAVQATVCVLDLAEVVVDGVASPALLEALRQATVEALARYDWEGVAPPALRAGSFGREARALGAALLPLHAAFATS